MFLPRQFLEQLRGRSDEDLNKLVRDVPLLQMIFERMAADFQPQAARGFEGDILYALGADDVEDVVEEAEEEVVVVLRRVGRQLDDRGGLFEHLPAPVEDEGTAQATEPDLAEWRSLVGRIDTSQEPVTIAVVGKYISLRDAYLSVIEALRHGGFHHGVWVNIQWVASDELVGGEVEDILGAADGILVPGGFGVRGVEGKVDAIRYAREHEVPYLGLCLGLQCAVIEFARTVCGLEDANSTEFEPGTPHPVIDLLPEQEGVTDMGGTMRLGAQPAHLRPGSVARRASRALVHSARRWL